MAAQPHVLVYHQPQADGTTIRRAYTPDLAVLMRDGEVVVIDFKIAGYAQLPKWQAKAALITEAYERDHSVTFSVVTNEAIYVQPRHQNVGILLAHRAIVRDGEALVAVRAAVALLGLPTTIDEVRRLVDLPSSSEHVDRAFTALVTMALDGEIRFDLGRPLLAPGAPLLAPGGRVVVNALAPHDGGEPEAVPHYETDLRSGMLVEVGRAGSASLRTMRVDRRYRRAGSSPEPGRVHRRAQQHADDDGRRPDRDAVPGRSVPHRGGRGRAEPTGPRRASSR